MSEKIPASVLHKGADYLLSNKLHWSLDVALREDGCKIHRCYAAENLARVGHIASNYL